MNFGRTQEIIKIRPEINDNRDGHFIVRMIPILS
jgi:hypothetical protein